MHTPVSSLGPMKKGRQTLSLDPYKCTVGIQIKNKPATILVIPLVIKYNSTEITHAASHPNACSAPPLFAQGIWKYGTAKPPSVRARLSKALTSPSCRGKQLFTYASYGSHEKPDQNKRMGHSEFALTDSHGRGHNRDFSNSPSEDHSDYRKLVLKGKPGYDNPCDVKRKRNVAHPGPYPKT